MIKTRKSNRYFSNIVDAKLAVTERHPTKKILHGKLKSLDFYQLIAVLWLVD